MAPPFTEAEFEIPLRAWRRRAERAHRSQALARAHREERQPPLVRWDDARQRPRALARDDRGERRAPDDAAPGHPRIGAGAAGSSRRRRGVAHGARRLVEATGSVRGLPPRTRCGARQLFSVPPAEETLPRPRKAGEAEHGPATSGYVRRRNLVNSEEEARCRGEVLFRRRAREELRLLRLHRRDHVGIVTNWKLSKLLLNAEPVKLFAPARALYPPAASRRRRNLS